MQLKISFSSVGCLIEFVTMPFGWFSGPSKEAPSPQVETAPAAKSRSTQCEMSNCRSSESGRNQALLCVSNYETETRWLFHEVGERRRRVWRFNTGPSRVDPRRLFDWHVDAWLDLDSRYRTSVFNRINSLLSKSRIERRQKHSKVCTLSAGFNVGDRYWI